MLQKVGYRADVAANGVEALEALERQPYDAVLMDVEMPEMDGLEATRRIHRRWPRERRPHIVAVTANAMQGERELCIQAGMDDYIAKPIHIDELTAALSRARRRPSASAPPAAVDDTVIGKLVTSLGEHGRASVAALIETFLGHVPDQIASLSTALGLREADVIRREAHTLKSNAATFGAPRLVELCRELEAGAKAGTLDGAPDLLAGIATELERVTDELGKIHAELGA
jgi:CheY-like chemotaxis protein/HPt (histidine-containing phosphotransfer) domain-containing protein